jgi:hypothetical protein
LADQKDPLERPISAEASKKAMDAASKILNEIHDHPEWEKMIGLIIGNLTGHGLSMISRHRGGEAAKKWMRMVETVITQHLDKGEGEKPDGKPKPA